MGATKLIRIEQNLPKLIGFTSDSKNIRISIGCKDTNLYLNDMKNIVCW